ncbi:hypothetical protein SAMD00023353_0500900 [Rosellinia necatrix]|uniref:Altered inheritance of mitochondria protein 19 n=1 Tax=Rosellinia necatrix TaxID=77044 RepID=A0A1S7UKY1_ROSNE|nr:hypothetical protein SAMD00023353_0500900 [Rosellinia necatrix]
MATPEAPQSLKSSLEAWGNSSLAPTGLATLITPLHLRPAQPLPLLFVPVLLFSSYANLQGFKIDSAGLTMATSGTYALLALRRKPAGGFRSKYFSVRGVVRGAAVGLGVMNAVAAGLVYATGNREKEKQDRKDNPKWTE